MIGRRFGRAAVALAAASSALCVGPLVAPSAAAVSSVSPAAVGQGGSRTITVSGSGFTNLPTTPDITVSGSGVSVTGEAFVNASTLTAVVTVAPGAAPGPRNVVVTQGVAGLDVQTCAGCFTVNAAPVVVAAAPADLVAGVRHSVVLGGSGLGGNPEVTASNPAVQILGRRSTSTERLVVDALVPVGTTSGANVLTVTAADGGTAQVAVPVVAASQTRRFVTNVYGHVLVRLPDRAGSDGWTGAVLGGTSRVAVAESIQASVEARRLVVTFFYGLHLRRAPDPGGLAFFADRARTRTLQSIEADLMASAEYFTTRGGGTNAGWIQAAYQDLLGRPAEPAAVQGWSQVMAGGSSRHDVALQLAFSSEAVRRHVAGAYERYLGRSADLAGLEAWRRLIQQGMRIETFVANILGSDEFLARS